MFPIHDDNPAQTTPVVTIALLVACVAVYLWQLSLSPQAQAVLFHSYGVIPAVLFGERSLPIEWYRVEPEWTLFSSMFLHGGFMHLLGNMLFLWIFGNNVEDAMGHGRFVVFYLLCGLAAAFSQALPATESVVPMIGASGAISGVLGAYLLLYPHARILVVVPIFVIFYTVHLPASVVLGIWFVLQIVSSLFMDTSTGGVAWYAHIGGFVAGVLLIPWFRKSGVHLWAPPRDSSRGG